MAGVAELAESASTRLVMRLLVRVSVVARATRVSVEVGRVSVPVFVMVEMTGLESVGAVARTLLPDPVEVSQVGADAPELTASTWLAVPIGRFVTVAEAVA